MFVGANIKLELTLPVSSVSRLSPLVQISLTEASGTQSPITVFSVSKIKHIETEIVELVLCKTSFCMSRVAL